MAAPAYPADAGTADCPDPYLIYLDVLRELGNQGAAVNNALIAAHTADTPHRRRKALTGLHTRLRHMAATVNDALGAGPRPDGTLP